jgi:acetyl esterase/lipase
MVAPSATWPTIEEDLVWACPDGVELRARLYRPSQPSLHPAPVLLDVHGGIWSSGDRTNDVAYCRPLAKQGFIVASVDFRQGPQSKHPAASIDVRNALRWVRLHAEEWGGAGATVGVIGTSSGAHLAMLAGIGYDAAGLDETPTPIAGIGGGFEPRVDIPARPGYVVALVPVADPYARYQYGRRAGRTSLVEGAESYFGTTDVMRTASVSRLVSAGDAQSLPPLLVVQAGDDANVPLEMTMGLLHAWQSWDGYVE